MALGVCRHVQHHGLTKVWNRFELLDTVEPTYDRGHARQVLLESRQSFAHRRRKGSGDHPHLELESSRRQRVVHVMPDAKRKLLERDDLLRHNPFTLRCFSRRNVFVERQVSGDTAIEGSYRTRGEADLDRRAILATTNELDTGERFAGHHAQT